MFANHQGHFRNKVVIVTGASRGIGRATTLRFAAAGAKLIVTARSEQSLQATVDEVRHLGAEIACVATPDGDVDCVLNAALSRFGGVDILINNAGTTKTGSFLSLTDEDWTDGYATKMFAAMRLCRAAWPALKTASGSVLNMAGAYGRFPDSSSTINSSVNAAVMAFTKSLAQLGAEDGVQVNAINPGFIKTDRHTHRVKQAAERWNVPFEEAETRLLAEFGISRFGSPEELADLIAFIVSPSGRLFQGALIDADGGFNKGI